MSHHLYGVGGGWSLWFTCANFVKAMIVISSVPVYHVEQGGGGWMKVEVGQ